MRARALDSYLLCRVYARLDIVCCGVFVLAEGDAAVYAQQTTHDSEHASPSLTLLSNHACDLIYGTGYICVCKGTLIIYC